MGRANWNVGRTFLNYVLHFRFFSNIENMYCSIMFPSFYLFFFSFEGRIEQKPNKINSFLKRLEFTHSHDAHDEREKETHACTHAGGSKNDRRQSHASNIITNIKISWFDDHNAHNTLYKSYPCLCVHCRWMCGAVACDPFKLFFFHSVFSLLSSETNERNGRTSMSSSVCTVWPSRNSVKRIRKINFGDWYFCFRFVSYSNSLRCL